jgi:hypothetical protein
MNSKPQKQKIPADINLYSVKVSAAGFNEHKDELSV